MAVVGIDKLGVRLSFVFLLLAMHSTKIYAQTIDLFVGTYTENNISDGIYSYRFNLGNGDYSVLAAAVSPNSSFLARRGNRLLAVNENGGGRGQVSLFSISEGRLRLLDTISSFGDHPCHVSWSSDGKMAFVSNYSGGSLQTYLISDDQNSITLNESFRYDGAGPNGERQDASHIHSAFFDPDGRLYVSDLGSDQVYVYDVDDQKTSLVLNSIIHTIQGGGPRHIAFGSVPSLTAYVLLELTGQLTVYQKRDDEWQLRQILPISDYEFAGEHGAADIKVSPDGKFVYASNRGTANVITCYKVLDNGLLELVQVQPTLGKGPRNFNITPDGQYLLVANQESDNIVFFRRNLETGTLSDTGWRISVPSPVCIIF